MTTKRMTVSKPAAYENRLDRDPKSKTFGQKLHYPLHADGTVSEVGYRRATDAIAAHHLMVTKASELAHTEGYAAHDGGLDIQSNPYTGDMGRAWERGWKQADTDADQEARESESED